MVRKTVFVNTECIAGGVGPAELHTIVSKEELGGVGRLYSKVVLKPGSAVGYHQHVGETEPYYILSGHGIFIEPDGSRVPVGPGDVCVIKDKEFHGIENTSDTENLEFLALIYNVM